MKNHRIIALLFIFMILLSVGCRHTDKHNDSLNIVRDEACMAKSYWGIASAAYQKAAYDDFIIFLNDEVHGDSIEGLPDIKQVSL